jgi:hypothetical protein
MHQVRDDNEEETHSLSTLQSKTKLRGIVSDVVCFPKSNKSCELFVMMKVNDGEEINKPLSHLKDGGKKAELMKWMVDWRPFSLFHIPFFFSHVTLFQARE